MEKYTSDKKLAIVISHPIQYYSPLFRELAKEINLKVFYCFNPTADQQGKDGFGVAFKWDLDLLEGYEYEFLTNVSEYPSSAYRSGCDTPEVGKSLDVFKPTHVVTFGWHLKSFSQVLKYCKTKSIPIAVRGDSQLDPNQAWFKRLIKKSYYPFFLNQYDAFLSVGERNKAYLRSFNVPERKIIFSPHAVDQSFWKGEKLIHESFTFVWVAKFIPLKRVQDVIAAFIFLNKKYSQTRLKLIGTGPLEERAKNQAKGCSAISFLGFQNQQALRKEYLSADCIILSSESETWGLVVNEAFAGLPAIVSSACGCGPDLIDDKSGFVYPTADVKALGEAMKLMVENHKNIEVAKAIERKNEIYSYTSIVSSFKKYMDSF